MRHIIESIIGRRGVSGIPVLQQGDIIITRRDDIFIVLTDQDCLKKVLHPNSFSRYDMSKGAYVHGTGRDRVGFMNLSSFDNELEDIDGRDAYDIVQVWRNFWNLNTITSNDDIEQIIQTENLKLLKKSYKLIWKR